MTAYDHLRDKPPITAKQERLYRRWRAYLRDSKLTEPEQHRRAAHYADINHPIPKD
jgi:hypothetical protein